MSVADSNVHQALDNSKGGLRAARYNSGSIERLFASTDAANLLAEVGVSTTPINGFIPQAFNQYNLDGLTHLVDIPSLKSRLFPNAAPEASSHIDYTLDAWLRAVEPVEKTCLQR